MISVIRTAHGWAVSDGRVLEENGPMADAFLAGLAAGESGASEPEQQDGPFYVGWELGHRKRPLSPHAAKVQLFALRCLRQWAFVRRMVDEQGWSVVTVRSVLQYHWPSLQRATLGSDEFSVKLDIELALGTLTPRDATVLRLLMAGYGPADITHTFNTNGSRLVSRAVRALTQALESNNGSSQSNE